MDIKVKKNLILYNGYKLKCSIGKSGIKKNKKEGDLSTPKGIFGLGMVYYRKDRNKKIKTKLKIREIKRNMGWCDDETSKKYNQEIKLPFAHQAERLHRKDKIYDILINIKYNQNPIKKGRGSAIFLHLTDKMYRATRGCIAIQKKDLLKILPKMNLKTKIIIK